MKTTDPEETDLPADRTQPQHRRVDSDAAAPAGEPEPAILDLPATAVNPADLGPLSVQLPGVDELPLVKDGRVVSRPGQSPAALAGLFAPGDPATDGSGSQAAPSSSAVTDEVATDSIATDDGDSPGTGSETSAPLAVDSDASGELHGSGVDQDGIPLGDDGQPLTRRQLRESRRRQERERQEWVGAEDHLRGAGSPEDAPAGVVGATVQPHAGTGELGETDRLETSRGPASEAAVLTGPIPAVEDDPATASVRHDPVEARHAHGLEPLAASEWGARERTLVIVAAAVFLILVIALILALVL